MAYATYPMPEDYPDYPEPLPDRGATSTPTSTTSASATASASTTEVTDVSPAEPRTAACRVSGHAGATATARRASGVYSSVLVANGHHWDARWPDPPFPGQDDVRRASSSTSTTTSEPDVLRRQARARARDRQLGDRHRRRELADRRRDASSRCAGARTCSRSTCSASRSTRRTASSSRALPLSLQRAGASGAALGRISAGKMGDRLRAPPNPTTSCSRRTRRSPPTCSLGSDTATSRSSRTSSASPASGLVKFADGSEEEVDLVVYCTGYRISFPFFDEGFLSAPDNQIPLYRRVVDLEHDGPLLHRAPAAARGDHAARRGGNRSGSPTCSRARRGCPRGETMRRVIDREDARMGKRYVASKRHTIQVDFHPYLRTIERERRAGARRGRPLAGRLARRSHELAPRQARRVTGADQGGKASCAAHRSARSTMAAISSAPSSRTRSLWSAPSIPTTRVGHPAAAATARLCSGGTIRSSEAVHDGCRDLEARDLLCHRVAVPQQGPHRQERVVNASHRREIGEGRAQRGPAG